MLDLLVLGRHIQGLRHGRGLTLQHLADAADVSVSMLSSVERGQKAPTITVLARIAEGLGVPLPELVAQSAQSRAIVRRAADQDTVDEPGGWHRTVLSPVVPGVNFEWIRTTLPPGCDAGTFPAYAPGSHEFIAVQSGTLRLTLGDEILDLGEGDSAYFAADVTHGYANPGQEPCTYHVAALIMRPRSTPSHRSLPGGSDGRHTARRARQ
ncbi:helix-turn-helix domain-containing protein [Streptomyces spongiae]|uniref:Helix-turn-helix transcriptional regulator n=1 Tax=Streptomyces spongiae TaxID=565072 RepID=A0A5N8XAB2_9ACTN|nr:XRE family transcriptional regulator [Streptomyces spongiae]MPY56441.1 helix-turn-helix transcriptional regulator [Streptomyces spongiae]